MKQRVLEEKVIFTNISTANYTINGAIPYKMGVALVDSFISNEYVRYGIYTILEWGKRVSLITERKLTAIDGEFRNVEVLRISASIDKNIMWRRGNPKHVSYFLDLAEGKLLSVDKGIVETTRDFLVNIEFIIG